MPEFAFDGHGVRLEHVPRAAFADRETLAARRADDPAIFQRSYGGGTLAPFTEIRALTEAQVWGVGVHSAHPNFGLTECQAVFRLARNYAMVGFVNRKMGRPKKGVKEKRSEAVLVKLTKPERAAADKARGDTPLATYIREKAAL